MAEADVGDDVYALNADNLWVGANRGLFSLSSLAGLEIQKDVAFEGSDDAPGVKGTPCVLAAAPEALDHDRGVPRHPHGGCEP
jgi:hypothetical protein